MNEIRKRVWIHKWLGIEQFTQKKCTCICYHRHPFHENSCRTHIKVVYFIIYVFIFWYKSDTNHSLFHIEVDLNLYLPWEIKFFCWLCWVNFTESSTQSGIQEKCSVLIGCHPFLQAFDSKDKLLGYHQVQGETLALFNGPLIKFQLQRAL